MAKSAKEFINDFNHRYELLHKNFEENFWATKMDLKGNSTEKFNTTKKEYDNFLNNSENLEQVAQYLAQPNLTADEKKILQIMHRTFSCYAVPKKYQDEILPLKNELIDLETKLETIAHGTEWSYKDKDGKTVQCTRKALFAILRTHEDEQVRKSCWECVENYPQHIIKPFAEIIKLRNKIAKKMGYKNYYDYKVQQAEGFDQKQLFSILDDLELQTRQLNLDAMALFAKEKGKDAILPHNCGYYLSGGDLSKETDPYFPFEKAVDCWLRTFAGLGIDYNGATLNLDLCDRKGKYPNGFCHWPKVAWRDFEGRYYPSVANFTSLASPNVTSSGHEALATLLHEGGHAAHFANIDQLSPYFAQERAPMSVAYAETQSMFLDSLIHDGDWLSRFAKNKNGEPIPWELIKKELSETYRYRVRSLRRMLAVCYYEKAIYDLDDAQCTADNILKIAHDVDHKLIGEWKSMPTLLVPHILSDESSAYYHGYVLAEMCVYQTRAFFEKKYHTLTDNPKIGKDLKEKYWIPGNSENFLVLVENLTGSKLKADAWVKELSLSLEDKLVLENKKYEEGKKKGPLFPDLKNVEMNMHLNLVDGDELISSSDSKGYDKAIDTFSSWIHQRFPKN